MDQKLYKFKENSASFISKLAPYYRRLYFPLCGIDAVGIKSSITPFLSGDIKIDKFNYLTKPVSTEDLRQDTRNIFCAIDGKGVFSMTQMNADEGSQVEAGLLWHKSIKKDIDLGIEVEALNFVPVTGENVELMKVTITNISDKNQNITPTVSIPLFVRALANKHDHEHVTSLLHRIQQLSEGVLVEPTMVFNEEGHKPCQKSFFVFGVAEDGVLPQGSFPTVDSFCGDQGTLSLPSAVYHQAVPEILSDSEIQGKEAMGALRFESFDLEAQQSKTFFVMIGIEESKEAALTIFSKFETAQQYDEALTENIKFWEEKTSSILFNKGDNAFNSWMRWVTLQPVLRRIYGCSFLPDHDYGKGGKGWRDIWQDLLSLILIEPEEVRESLVNNFAGVRMDGSNATIIGSVPGEFFADRNAITRVWMDHGVWPFTTLLLYINQTGDFDILSELNTYFRDPQMSRSFVKDKNWTSQYGNKLKDVSGKEYQGTLLEHILVQHLTQFFNVGEHNICRLESADWNDGLDMAFDRGESVTFMSFYAGNLLALADLLEDFSKTKNIENIEVAKEMVVLFDSLNKKVDYEHVEAKQKFLFETYFTSVQPEVSGETIKLKIEDIVKDLRGKGQWVFEHIRKQEKISVDQDGKEYSWFNGYYDNKGKRVEGQCDDHVRMTLTGQVFPVMSGLASEEEVAQVVESARMFLKDQQFGGFKLNSDFKVKHYLDLGRAFGFAYGTKENGAVFCHMTVMYANALYSRGFVREGYEVINSLYEMSMDTDRSKIFPGVPEYFDGEGRGMYHYLTGSASWFVLTELTQVFGVKGFRGDLILQPQLVKEEFSAEGKASVTCQFAGKKCTVEYVNQEKLDWGEYKIRSLQVNNIPYPGAEIMDGKVCVSREQLEQFLVEIKLTVDLVRK